MEPWGTPALTAYSCEDFPSRTTQSRLLLRKKEIRPNIWPEIPQDLSLWRRWACQNLSKALDLSSATARVAPDLLKALAILSYITVRRSEVDQEDLQPYWKSEKRPHFSWWSIILFPWCYTLFLQMFTLIFQKLKYTEILDSAKKCIVKLRAQQIYKSRQMLKLVLHKHLFSIWYTYFYLVHKMSWKHRGIALRFHLEGWMGGFP